MTALRVRTAYQLRSTAEGLLDGICVPFDEVTYTAAETPRGERFRAGAFTKTLQRNVKKIRLKSLHAEEMPVGKAVSLREETDGLYGTFQLYDTPEGRAAAERAREGVYGGLSIEFRPVQQRAGAGGVTEVTEAALHAVALELDPAYTGARVLAVRSAAEEADAYAWMWQQPTPAKLPAAVDYTRFLTQ